MAGMDWFRWHHGSVNDPKFQLVAKRSKSSVAEVIAVWACLLEAASMADSRGIPGTPDYEAIECSLGLDDGQALRIVEAMQARDLLTGSHCQIAAWDKRQPKREREDNSAAERKQNSRNAASGVTADVTPSHTTSHQNQPRGEERRLEEIRKEGEGGIPRATSADASEGMKSTGLQGVDPSHPKLSALLEIGITTAELVAASIDAVNKKKPFAYALATAEGRRRDSVLSPLPAAAKADPDSRSAIEADGVAMGLGRWNETEQFSTYKARVRGNPQPILSLVALAGMAAQHQGATA